MKKIFRSQYGYGGVEMFLCAAIIGIIMYFYFYPAKFNKFVSEDEKGGGMYCRTILDDANAPTLTAPTYKNNTVDESKPRQYRMVKKNVPITPYVWGGPAFAAVAHYEHLSKSWSGGYTDPETGKQFVIRIPNGEGGRSYDFQSSYIPGQSNALKFEDYGLLLVYHVNETGEPITLDDAPTIHWTAPHMIDVYKAVDSPPLPQWVLQCLDDPAGVPYIPKEKKELDFYYPNASGSAFKAEEQLNWFLFQRDKYLTAAWWIPHCKPAIYLYPEREQEINVQVHIPNGSFLYTDPVYPSGGWNVLAKPNGELKYLGENLKDSKGKVNYPNGMFPYMYYEARIHDSVIEKPTKGFVIAYDQLANFYDHILPQLGLNEKETKEFKEYWLKALPTSPYYFIGVVSQDNLDEIEPLSITPKQDTTIRVSLYFEALNKPKVVQEPEIQRSERVGFTVVEWGGMIKRDKDHPFTCLQ